VIVVVEYASIHRCPSGQGKYSEPYALRQIAYREVHCKNLGRRDVLMALRNR